MATQKFLVLGATGKQGGAVVDALLTQSSACSTPIHIFALTRNPDSGRATSLASKPNITVIQGDPTNPSAIFSQTGPIDGVFCMTVPDKIGAEEEQAKPMIDESITHGVAHFVYSSGDRGGPEKSDNTETKVPNLAAKYRIEKHLKEKSAGTSMKWTILRPTTFFDMLSGDMHGKGFGAMWDQVGSKPIQMISTKDIGHFAAAALLNPDKYSGQAISLAGDELNFEEASKIFKETTGKKMPRALSIIAMGVKLLVGDVGVMFAWMKSDRYGADIQALRKEYPQLQDFRTWLKESSDFRN